MNRFVLAATIAALSTASAFAAPETYILDPNHTFPSFDMCKPNPMTKKEVCGADATAELDRAAFGVNLGEAYGFKMGVKLQIQVEGSPAG